jgi:hypothetical protein
MNVDNERAYMEQLISDLQDKVKNMEKLKLENLKHKESLSNLYEKGIIDKDGNLKE